MDFCKYNQDLFQYRPLQILCMYKFPEEVKKKSSWSMNVNFTTLMLWINHWIATAILSIRVLLFNMSVAVHMYVCFEWKV